MNACSRTLPALRWTAIQSVSVRTDDVDRVNRTTRALNDLMRTGDTGGVTIVNPNLLALKMAEGLADLHQKGAYTLSRLGFYEQPKGHYREQFLAERRKTAKALGLTKPAKAAE